MLRQVLEALARGEFEMAVAQATDVLSRYPEMAEAHHLLAVGHGALGNHELALASVEQAIVLAPENTVFHVTKGSIQARSSGIDAAEATLRGVVRNDPNAFAAYVSLAHLAISRGDFADAHQHISRAERIDDAAADVLILRGIEVQSRDKLDEASALYSAAVRKAPASALAHASLGLCFLAQGYHAFAEQSLQTALQIQPLNRGLRWALLRALTEQGHAEKALQQLDILVEQAPTDPVAHNLRAETLMQTGRIEEAAAAFTALLHLVPDHPLAISRVVQAYTALGRYQDAVELLEQRLISRPERDDLWALRLGVEEFDLDSAAGVTERWFAARPTSAAVLEAMAQLSELRGQATQAEEYADRALALDADLGAAQLVKLRAELRQRPDLALARTQRLLAQAKQSEARRSMLHWHGLALDACDRPAPALQAWREMWTHNTLALPLPNSRPASGEVADAGASPPTLVWALPGTPAEQLVMPLAFTASHVLMQDRFTDMARLDGVDPFKQAPLNGVAPGSYAAWRAGVEALGYDPERIIDWVPHWDAVMQEQFANAKLVVLLADPRDMLLNWLAFGCSQRYSAADTERAALWLHHVLQPLVAFRTVHPERVLLLTDRDVVSDRDGTLQRISAFAAVEFRDEARIARSLAYANGRVRSGFAPGHWRTYGEVLAPAFEGLAELADALGVAVE
jgi:tetratricopeptide (TPR) repeat protein